MIQVSTFDKAGGAEALAQSLNEHLIKMGHSSLMAVGYKRGDTQECIRLSTTRN